MHIYAISIALAVSLVCGCSSTHFTRSHGDLGEFILREAVSSGGKPSVSNGLPIVTTNWRYAKDVYGMQIHLSAADYPRIEEFLNKALAGWKQFGPQVSEDGSCQIHEYRMSAVGGGIQLAKDGRETSVIILKPRMKR